MEKNCDFQRNIKAILESQQSALNKIPQTVAKEVKSQLKQFEDKLSSAIAPIKADVEVLKNTMQKVITDYSHLSSLGCKSEIVISGIPETIKDPKALRDIVLKIGEVYDISVRYEEVYQCIRLKKEGKVLVKFCNLFIKDDIMKSYLKAKNLKLHQIVDTDVESRVYLNNNFPPDNQRNILYCRLLKKLNLIKDFSVNFKNGFSTITNLDKTTTTYNNFKDLSSDFKITRS
ncbi:hypothetical protein ACFFRR_005417 [Megaselia abdita]